MNILTFCRKTATRFMQQSKGAIAIEAAITLVAFVTVVALIIDLGSAFIQQSRLERATYTAATVFRERVALYNDTLPGNKNRNITQIEVNQLQKIVSQLVSQTDLVVMVEELQFRSVTTPPVPTAPVVDTYNTFIAAGPTSSTGTCSTVLPTLNSSTYTKLSPWSSRKRWLPIYRVTVCLPGEKSWYKSMINSSAGTPELTINELIAFNIVIPR